MKQIAILGGSFDPVHNGHLRIAETALKKLAVDEVWFLLSADTPLKKRELTSYHHRYEMLKLAVSNKRKFKVCTIEKYHQGKNYTIDTMKRLKRKYPKYRFKFLLGADQVEQLDEWKDIDKLVHTTELYVVNRPGYVIESPFNLNVVEMEELDISSSDIRLGKCLDIPNSIKRYIMQQGLYPERLRMLMSDYRYEHSIRVATLSRELAKTNGYKEEVAYLAGLYHDIMKEYKIMSFEEAKLVLKNLNPEILTVPEGIWHGYLGRYVCSRMGIQNKQVLQAIEHHVLGDSLGIYDQILYVSDKLDPLRKYDTSKTRELAYKDIRKAFKEVKKQQEVLYIGVSNGK